MNDVRHSLSQAECKELRDEALECINLTRSIITKYWNDKTFSVESKDDASPVTQADLESELAFREFVEKRFPSHGIIGEEFPSLRPEADFQWTIDPIDGTQNFAAGIPTFGTMLSVRYRNQPIVGIIEHPALERIAHAGYGLGTYFNGTKVQIPNPARSALAPDTVVLTSTRGMFSRTDEAFLLDRFMQTHPTTRIYYDCFAHSLVAWGAAPALIEFNVRMWDASPTELLITEAGGRFEYIRESPAIDKRNFLSFICGQPRLVELLLPLFASEDELVA